MYALTILANAALIAFTVVIFTQSYDHGRIFILLLLIPPVLSIKALSKGGDKEERTLKKRIRKATLRKELKELSEFDKSE